MAGLEFPMPRSTLHLPSLAVGALVSGVAVATVLRMKRRRTRFTWKAVHTLKNGKACTTRAALANEYSTVMTFVEHLAEADGGIEQITATPEEIRAAFERGDLEVLFVEMAGVVVGMAIFQDSFRTFSGASLYLQDLVVAEGHRGCGIGTLLIRTLAAIALSRGCDRLFWESHLGNVKANDFYSATVGAENVRGDEQLLTWKLIGKKRLAANAKEIGL